ncbi:MAG: hypothetical protein QM728_13415 [Gordonia sp. (in: high G+C Gram-positive bacteria)]|uniref:hypothetical protein n=1 Tax=Gordonia sp. (in: high G+C Gram-positive bacteria) TaxID=84139 RepID=UPI0039E31264
MAHVIGIAVVDGQIVSVVRDDTDAVVATNSLNLADESAATITAAVDDLVSSAPFDVSRIGVVTADPALVDQLRASFQAPGGPVWHADVVVDVLDSAMATLIRTAPGQHAGQGAVALVNLDEYTAPTAGIPILAVDQKTGAVAGRATWQPSFDEPTAVLDPSGAANVARAIAAMPGGDDVTAVVCTGTGAGVPGVRAAFEQALGRPVAVVPEPQYALAGAAAGLARTAPDPASGTFAAAPSQAFSVPPVPAYSVDADDSTTSVVAGPSGGARGGSTPRPPADRQTRRRWWLLGGTAAAGFLILGAAIAAVLFSTGTAQKVVGVTTVSVSTETRTVTHTETQSNHTTQHQTDTTTVRPAPRTTTVTKTTTQPPSTVTSTVTETVTEQPGPDDGEGDF